MAVIVRVAVAAVAVAVLAWFAILERDVRLQASAQAEGHRDPAAADRGLRRSELLRPGSDADLHRAAIIGADNRFGEARGIVQDVLRREPDNLQAWLELLFFTRGRDPGAAAQATRAIVRLDPLSASRPVLAAPARRP